MTIYRCILSKWAATENPTLSKALEGAFSDQKLKDLNNQGYNIYWNPNYASNPTHGKPIDGSMIDVFTTIFVDFDLKSGAYASKEDFISALSAMPLEPSRIVDSGGGIHVYWKVSDLDGMSFLRLSRRLMRLLNTDDAVQTLYQLMRVPGTFNTKLKDEYRMCEELYVTDTVYTCEDIDRVLPKISEADEKYCIDHYNKTFGLNLQDVKVDDRMPIKFADLVKNSKEVKNIWSGNVEDRSAADYRLCHIMLASGFTKDESISVLLNSSKALARGPQHRINYALNIVDKIYPEEKPAVKKASLSMSIDEIMNKASNNSNKGTKFECHPIVDATHAGFRLGQVFGLVGGSGSGKTTFTLNLFRWFAERNPNYIHMFVSLEQPQEEIAKRWVTMCGDNETLRSMVKILGNYNDDGTFRNLSLADIKDHVLEVEKETGKKIGCVVLDHVGALKKKTKEGENQGLIEVFQALKPFAVETNTFFVVQSQTSREKAGIGDLELDKDAAYGSTLFEWYVDFLMTIWQPLKRVYKDAKNMTVTAFKYCKIRQKNIDKDNIQEDQRYKLIFDPNTERFRELTQIEEKSFVFFNNQATNIRKKDRKTDVLEYNSISWTTKGATDGAVNIDKDTTSVKSTTRVH